MHRPASGGRFELCTAAEGGQNPALTEPKTLSYIRFLYVLITKLHEFMSHIMFILVLRAPKW